MKFIYKILSLLVLIIVLIILADMGKKVYDNRGVRANHKPNVERIKKAENLLRITPNPNFNYSYEIMKKGVIQHLDRDYTYDVIPEELENGILFQGIHRPPKGTIIQIELLKPGIIYFFFHETVNGGYAEIFPNLKQWEKSISAPQYDIYNGSHGLKMIMYKMVAKEGIYILPPTQVDKACFSIVFKSVK